MELNEKIMALALFLDIDPDEIKQADYDDDQFQVNPRTVKEGDSPESYVKDAAELHAFLAERGQDKKTWQELAPMTDRQYRDELLYKLEATAGFEPSDRYRGDRTGVLVPNLETGGDIVVGPSIHSENGERLRMLEKMHPRSSLAYERFKRSLLGWDEFGKRWNDWPQKDGEIHFYANAFYHLICGEENGFHDWHIYALRTAFNGEVPEDRRRDGFRDDGEYLVLTDDEADEKAKESVESYVDECVLGEIPEQYRDWFDKDGFVEHCISVDGRAHSIASYDGEENMIDLDEFNLDMIRLLGNHYDMPTDNPHAIVEKALEDTGEDVEDYSGEYYIYRTN